MADKKKILGVDFDDVIFHFDEAAREFHLVRYGGPAYTREDRATFDLAPTWNCTQEEVTRRLNEFTESEFHERTPIVSGAKAALQALSAVYDIVIVTGRARTAQRATEAWLERNLLGLYRELHFTNHGGNPYGDREKSEILSELGASAFVEDHLYFAKDVAGAGIPVFLLDTPWNRHETPPGVTRVYSWDEVVAHLLPPHSHGD